MYAVCVNTPSQNIKTIIRSDYTTKDLYKAHAAKLNQIQSSQKRKVLETGRLTHEKIFSDTMAPLA
jgi:hypothetical protein